MNGFPASLFFRTSKFSLIMVLYSILTGCGIESSNLNKTDDNQTISLPENSVSPLVGLDPKVIPGADSKVLELLLEKYIGEIIPKINQSIPQPIKVDYARLENSFLKMLMDNNSEESKNKYQFICDENERWIYRCNMETGEIECFSMSSNKLRLLSSVK
jgi:hypothetical protein